MLLTRRRTPLRSIMKKEVSELVCFNNAKTRSSWWKRAAAKWNDKKVFFLFSFFMATKIFDDVAVIWLEFWSKVNPFIQKEFKLILKKKSNLGKRGQWPVGSSCYRKWIKYYYFVVYYFIACFHGFLLHETFDFFMTTKNRLFFSLAIFRILLKKINPFLQKE